jgi:hypothetical protein
MSKSQWRWVLTAFALGAFVPIFWGIMGFVLFNVPEGAFSRAFWQAVYVTCPSRRIEGTLSYLLTPLLNGLMYAAITAAAMTPRPRDTSRRCRDNGTWD